MSIRVLLADDSEVMRAAIVRLLKEERGEPPARVCQNASLPTYGVHFSDIRLER